MALELTIYIAIYGAIVSTIAIVWNIIKDIKDKPSVKVSAHIGFITFKGNADSESVYSFSAVNKSKRVVTLTNAGIKVENEGNIQFIDNHNLPKKLNEGDKVTFFRKVNDFYPQVLKHNVKYLWFKDTIGREYKSKKIKKLFSIDYRSNPSQ